MVMALYTAEKLQSSLFTTWMLDPKLLYVAFNKAVSASGLIVDFRFEEPGQTHNRWMFMILAKGAFFSTKSNLFET